MDEVEVHPGAKSVSGIPIIIDPDDNQRKRHEGLRCVQRLSIIIGFLAIMALVFGCLAIYFGSPVYRFPFSFPGAIIVGFVMFVGSVIGCCAAGIGRNQIESTGRVRCLVISFYVICIMGIIFGILCAAISIWAVVACKTGAGDMLFGGCLPYVDENIAFAAVNIIAGFLLAIFAIPGSCIFCCYGKVFGIKSRWERRMEKQVRVMNRARFLKQQQTNPQQQGRPQGNYQGQDRTPDRDQGHSNMGTDLDSDIDVQRF